MLGSVLELLYASARGPEPSAATNTNVRRKPLRRDAIVPSAITLAERERLGLVSRSGASPGTSGPAPARGMSKTRVASE